VIEGKTGVAYMRTTLEEDKKRGAGRAKPAPSEFAAEWVVERNKDRREIVAHGPKLKGDRSQEGE
jgi:hypothetical protein